MFDAAAELLCEVDAAEVVDVPDAAVDIDVAVEEDEEALEDAAAADE